MYMQKDIQLCMYILLLSLITVTITVAALKW